MAIAQTAAERITDFVGDEPFCIFGHSMGAFVAYETEALLEAHYGKQAARLILSGQHPPVCFQPHHYGFGSDEELNGYLMKLGGFPEEVQTNLQMFRMLFTVCRDDIRPVSYTHLLCEYTAPNEEGIAYHHQNPGYPLLCAGLRSSGYHLSLIHISPRPAEPVMTICT